MRCIAQCPRLPSRKLNWILLVVLNKIKFNLWPSLLHDMTSIHEILKAPRVLFFKTVFLTVSIYIHPITRDGNWIAGVGSQISRDILYLNLIRIRIDSSIQELSYTKRTYKYTALILLSFLNLKRTSIIFNYILILYI